LTSGSWDFWRDKKISDATAEGGPDGGFARKAVITIETNADYLIRTAYVIACQIAYNLANF